MAQYKYPILAMIVIVVGGSFAGMYSHIQDSKSEVLALKNDLATVKADTHYDARIALEEANQEIIMHQGQCDTDGDVMRAERDIIKSNIPHLTDREQNPHKYMMYEEGKLVETEA